MSFAVIITRLCPLGHLPNICGDVPDGLKPRGHIESQNPRAEIPPNMHGDFFYSCGFMVLFSIVFLFCVTKTLESI